MNKEKFLEIVSPYSMTDSNRIKDLYESLEYIRINNIEGDFVECGVWKGGNILGILEYLNFHKIYDRNIWLYDTFAGLTKPTEIDYTIHGTIDWTMSSDDVYNKWNQSQISETENSWCLSDLDTVKNVLSKSEYPGDKIFYVVGDILETLKQDINIPKSIALLRLDTDWYESTKKEMEVLYPKLNKNGILIVDDYGYWNGNKKAVDDYFSKNNIFVNILKIGDCCSIKIIKP